MPSLFELMHQTFGEEKTASAQPANQVAEPSQEDLVKVATDLGLYDIIFPEDTVAPASQEKTAAEKQAEAEEKLGMRAYDYFAHRLNSRLEKMAGEIMSAADMEAAQGIMQPEARPPQAVPTNSDPLLDKMPPNPVKETPYGVAVGTEAGAEAPVGHFEQKMAMALQKHMLKASLGV